MKTGEKSFQLLHILNCNISTLQWLL